MQSLLPRVDLLGMTGTRRDKGFTLVELLVVMVIIGILAGIAVPMFMGQREKAAKAAMASDLRMLRMAQESRGVENNPRYTTNISALRLEGYAQSDGVSEPHIRLSDGDNQYVACVRHAEVAEWLVYSSLDGTTSSAPTDCVT